MRVDFATPGSTDVGGAWPGSHAEPVTYVRHLVTPTNNRVGLHSGTPGGYFQAGVNGFQIRKVEPLPVLPGGPAGGSGIRRVTPNPSATPQRIEFALDRPEAGGALEIADLAGRVVWRAPLLGRPAGPQEIHWDGRDAAGRRVAAGIYFARLNIGGDPASSTEGVRRLVRLR